MRWDEEYFHFVKVLLPFTRVSARIVATQHYGRSTEMNSRVISRNLARFLAEFLQQSTNFRPLDQNPPPPPCFPSLWLMSEPRAALLVAHLRTKMFAGFYSKFFPTVFEQHVCFRSE